MKKNILLIVTLIWSLGLFSQYSVSSKTITFNDPDRDRNIECGVYYPSILDSNPGSVQFPYIIFGHGFSMNINPYSFFWEGIVPEGVIVILPKTETGLSPSHENFAKDLAFLGDYFFEQSLNASGHFYNSVRDDFFIMGHSMGGGSSHLASSFSQNAKAIVTFAAAETNPSAMEAAEIYTGKVVMFYGVNDNVTPFAEHQEPIFQNSASTCKTLIGIIGGIHCYFNNYNLQCSVGEIAAGSNATISREQQQDVVLDFVKLLVKSELYNDNQANNAFVDSVNNSNRVITQRVCETPTTVTLNEHYDFIKVYPNPAEDYIEFVMQDNTYSGFFRIYNIEGKEINSFYVNEHENHIQINVSNYPTGRYFVSDENYSFYKDFLIIR